MAVGPELGDRNLEIGQQLQQERLELVVGAVESSISRTGAFGRRIATSKGHSSRYFPEKT